MGDEPEHREREKELIREILETDASGFVSCGLPPVTNIWVLITFPVRDQEALEHIFKAEEHLAKAGISFDTGLGCHGRDWEFDWSLKGGIVRMNESWGERDERAEKEKEKEEE